MKKNQYSKVNPNLAREHSQEDREAITPGSDPFIIPEGYFYALPQRVMNKILNENMKIKVQSKTLNLLRQAWIPLALASSVALFLFLRHPYTLVNKANVSDSLAVSIHSNEYDPTYADEALFIEEAVITDNDEAQIDFRSMSNALNSSDTIEISADEKIQYLLEENYDTDLVSEL
jgi:hypothetical protein